MKRITVNASRQYDILVGPGLLSCLGQEALQWKGIRKICIVSDSQVYPLYGQKAEDILTESGFEVISFVFPAGEPSKNGNTYLELLDHLARNHLTRSDLIVALGGGVVGDLAGFAAATYLRGIRLIQVPTTLLAAVDSSVGGKTAIDLPSGKNLAGAFFQPNLVICDTELLRSLPKDIFRDGCAEVIKYGILYDPELFSCLEKAGLGFDRETVIANCVQWKCRAVAQDEFDTGVRMKLNLGHTIGHGVEAASGYMVSHGQAVAIGTAIAARSAAAAGICATETATRICRLLEQFGLPIKTDFSPEELVRCALSDKKRAGDTLRLILPVEIGHCEILPRPVDSLQTFVEAGF